MTGLKNNKLLRNKKIKKNSFMNSKKKIVIIRMKRGLEMMTIKLINQVLVSCITKQLLKIM